MDAEPFLALNITSRTCSERNLAIGGRYMARIRKQ